MYRKIEPTLRMTANEASARYPDEFIIMINKFSCINITSKNPERLVSFCKDILDIYSEVCYE